MEHTLNCHYCNRQVESIDGNWRHLHDNSTICMVPTGNNAAPGHVFEIEGYVPACRHPEG